MIKKKGFFCFATTGGNLFSRIEKVWEEQIFIFS
jgi:hypothetical protein